MPVLWQSLVPVPVPVPVVSVPCLCLHLDASAPVPGSSSKSQWPGSSLRLVGEIASVAPSFAALSAGCFLSLLPFSHRGQRMCAHHCFVSFSSHDLCLLFC